MFMQTAFMCIQVLLIEDTVSNGKHVQTSTHSCIVIELVWNCTTTMIPGQQISGGLVGMAASSLDSIPISPRKKKRNECPPKRDKKFERKCIIEPNHQFSGDMFVCLTSIFAHGPQARFLARHGREGKACSGRETRRSTKNDIMKIGLMFENWNPMNV